MRRETVKTPDWVHLGTRKTPINTFILITYFFHLQRAIFSSEMPPINS